MSVCGGAADRGEYRQAAGAVAEAVIRSVELIVQPDARLASSEAIVQAKPNDVEAVMESHVIG
jgi:hypothetical protein